MSSTAPPSVWGRALVYLGLWEEPETYGAVDPEPAPAQPEPAPERRAAAAAAQPSSAGTPSGSNVRPLRLAPEPEHVGRTEVIHVRTFEDCEVIGRRYREGAAVLFDLAEVDRTTARRVVDFVAGATYVAHGSLDKVGSRAFLLVPQGVSVPTEDRVRLEARGYRLADGA